MIFSSSIAIASDESLVIYSGRKDKFVKPVAQAFTKETGIKVILHTAKSTGLLNKMNLEGSRTDADLYLSNDAGNLERGNALGLFSPIPSEITKHIPANYRASNNNWVGLSARARILVVNKNSPANDNIKSVFDLAKPEYKGRIAITHSANESFVAGVTVYMESAGKEKVRDWLKGLQDNTQGDIYNKHSKVVKAVAKGKADVGLVNHYYVYRHLAKKPDAPIRIILPDQDGMGLAWNVAGAAINKHSDNKAAAERFLKFVTSEKGQKMFAESNNEYPTRIGVAASSNVPAIDTFKIAAVPMEKLGEKRNATIDLLQDVDMP
jgi:iron(III) transport system substrate-binding protein